MLGRRTCKYYYKTDEVPQPKADQPNPRKTRLKVACGRHFFPKMIFRGLGFMILCRKQTTRNPTQPKKLSEKKTVNVKAVEV